MLGKSACRFASFTLISILFITSARTAGAYTIMGNVDSHEKDGYNINRDRKTDFSRVRP